MIARLSYVMCDECGNAAEPADDAKEARALAAGQGYKRREGRDLCRRCALPPEGRAYEDSHAGLTSQLPSDQGNMAVWGHPDQWQGRDSDERERALRARVARLESGLQTIRDDERLGASYMRHIASVALDETQQPPRGRVVMGDSEHDDRRWQLTGGSHEHPTVYGGPSIRQGQVIEVVPASQLRGAVEDRDEAIRLLRDSSSPVIKPRQPWFRARRALLDRYPEGGQ
jgi:hypothetical protein